MFLGKSSKVMTPTGQKTGGLYSTHVKLLRETRGDQASNIR